MLRLFLVGGVATVLAAAGSDGAHLSAGLSLAITVGAGSVTTITVALISASGRRRDQRDLEADLQARVAEVIDLQARLREAKDDLAAANDELRRHGHEHRGGR